MRKIAIFILSISFFNTITFQAIASQASVSQSIEIRAVDNEKIRLALCVSPDASDQLKEVAMTIKSAIGNPFSEQFEVKIVSVTDFDHKDLMAQLSEKGYQLAIYLFTKKNRKQIEWSVYDLSSNMVVEVGSYKKSGEIVRGWGYAIADSLWPLITGQKGFFSSQIAYCKEVDLISGKKMAKHLYVADYDGSHEQLVDAAPTIKLAPRFNRDPQRQIVFYSQCTPQNIQLVSMSGNNKKRVILNFDGVSMFPSFSLDGSCVAYGASKGLGNCDIYYIKKGGVLEKITSNGGNNFSPVLSDDGTRIFYCSDIKNGVQQIYCYSVATNIHSAITTLPGDAWSPAYCEHNHQLAYCKRVKEVVQLFVYDELTKTHTQITFNDGHKDMCAWSPCGNYLIYCKTEKSSTRLACFNKLTGSERYLTSSTEKCSFPAWSGLYDLYPAIA